MTEKSEFEAFAFSFPFKNQTLYSSNNAHVVQLFLKMLWIAGAPILQHEVWGRVKDKDILFISIYLLQTAAATTSEPPNDSGTLRTTVWCQ